LPFYGFKIVTKKDAFKRRFRRHPFFSDMKKLPSFVRFLPFFVVIFGVILAVLSAGFKSGF
jgi:hypothetical protein